MKGVQFRPGSRGKVIQGVFPGGRPRLAVIQPESTAQAVKTPTPAAHVLAAMSRTESGREAPPAPSRAAQPFGESHAFEVPKSLNLSGRGGGRRLPDAVRQKMESFFGADFSDVRIHVGHEASSIGAIAFTHGSNIFFSHGQYNPASPQGQQLLGHELTHVLQQRAGRVRNPLGSGVAVVQDPGMEAEAERMGMRVVMAPEPVQAKSSPAGGRGGSGDESVQAKGGAQFRITQQTGGRGRQRLAVHRGGQCVGQAEVHAEATSVARVYNLKVDPAFRGQGAGDLLLRAAARAGAGMGKSRIALDSEDNGSGRLTRWYQREGFHRVGINERGMAVLEAPAQALLASRGGPAPQK